MPKRTSQKATIRAPKKASGKAPIDLELDPDAWPRFEKLVKSAAKMGHKPHSSTALSRKK